MYLGEKLISNVTEDGEFVTIEFEDKTKSQKMSKVFFDYLKSDESVENDELYTKKIHKVISDIMILFIQSGVNLHEINGVINGLVKSVETNKDIAIAKLFDAEFTSHITFGQINDIVVKK